MFIINVPAELKMDNVAFFNSFGNTNVDEYCIGFGKTLNEV